MENKKNNNLNQWPERDEVYQMASPDKGVGGVYRGGSGATLDADLTTRYLSVLPLILKRLQIMLCHINQN